MCGRASLAKNEKELEDRFGSQFYSEDIERYNPVPNYNLAPGQYFPIITNSDSNHFNVFKWGLIPFWAKDPKIAFKLINARAETIDKKSSFKVSFSRKRCLVPLDGFYEWKKLNRGKKPYRIVKNDKAIFSVAGLWDTWLNQKNEIVNSFTIITVSANEIMKTIHNRMPAILFEEEERNWIDESIPIGDLKNLLKPFPSDLIYAYPVSSKVNNVRNKDSDLINEVSENDIIQGRLF